MWRYFHYKYVHAGFRLMRQWGEMEAQKTAVCFWDLPIKLHSFYSWKPTVLLMRYFFFKAVGMVAGRGGGGWGGGQWVARQSEGLSQQSHFSLRWFSLVRLLPYLSVRVSSDCAPLRRSLSSGWCRPQPSRHFGLARAPPSGSPGEQQKSTHSFYMLYPFL